MTWAFCTGVILDILYFVSMVFVFKSLEANIINLNEVIEIQNKTIKTHDEFNAFSLFLRIGSNSFYLVWIALGFRRLGKWFSQIIPSNKQTR